MTRPFSLLPSILIVLVAVVGYRIATKWNSNVGGLYNTLSLLGMIPPSPNPLLLGHPTIEQQVAYLNKLTADNEQAMPEFLMRYAYGEDITSANYGDDQTIVTELQIPAGDHTIPTICSRPANSDGAKQLPLVMYYHFGGLILFSVKVEVPLIRYVSKALNAVVCSPEYRKAPEYPFPAALADASDAAFYLIQQLGTSQSPDILGGGVTIDPTKVVTFGMSAGGYLAGITPRVLALHNIPIALQVSLGPNVKPHAGTTSLLQKGKGDVWTRDWNTYAWSVYLPNDDGRLVNDWRVNLLADDPPESTVTLPGVYLSVGKEDVLYDEGRMYGNKLSQQGRLLEYVELENTNHGSLFPPLSKGGPGDGNFERSVQYIASFLGKL